MDDSVGVFIPVLARIPFKMRGSRSQQVVVAEWFAALDELTHHPGFETVRAAPLPPSPLSLCTLLSV